jgi:hypothetical protein
VVDPKGYRVEWKPGDPCYLSPAEYEHEAYKAGADVWPLFAEPQPGCEQAIEVYHGRCWVRPRYVSAVRDMTGFTPLYLGPLLQRGQMAEEVAHLFPSLVEDRLREARPDLYPAGVRVDDEQTKGRVPPL